MNGNNELLIDSVILIDHFNGNDEATHYLTQNVDISAISAITRAEGLTGFTTSHLKNSAIQLLDRFPSFSVDKDVADLAAKLRQDEGWTLPDAIQSAISIRHELQLATRNYRDFNPKNHQFVVVPYRLQ